MLDRDPLSWRTSSYSGNADGNCVEIAVASRRVYVRDTKDRDGGTHHYSRDAGWVSSRTFGRWPDLSSWLSLTTST
jgi:hypothetical protein